MEKVFQLKFVRRRICLSRYNITERVIVSDFAEYQVKIASANQNEFAASMINLK